MTQTAPLWLHRTALFAGALALAAGVALLARPSASMGAAAPAPPAQAGSDRWFKGNLHAHTLNSDGDSTPDDVVKWYREHGYQFVVLTDHNYLTSVTGLNALHGADDQFLVVRGEEVTGNVGAKPIHVNGLDVSRLVEPPGGTSVVGLVQGMVDAIRDARGVPSVNHPNFGWAISADELALIERLRLFEVFNAHPAVNNLGGGGVPGLEETWDRILTSGRLLYGIAVDDAHYFKRPEDTRVPRPGGAWVYVRAPRLEARALVAALERGEFYASTGVQLRSIEVTADRLAIAVNEQPSSRYRIQFIGRQGRVLSEAATPAATYQFKGDEGYVRAKIIESNGTVAWVQPVPVGAAAPK